MGAEAAQCSRRSARWPAARLLPPKRGEVAVRVPRQDPGSRVRAAGAIARAVLAGLRTRIEGQAGALAEVAALAA
eukprot:CAMPEP_0171232762 /NCGR_PEP_ID=MMETSP0790-20130122/40574_1 /TAXON_ID=2925 /ORGANISM="Alexandrium catenella, Strain OF101" /LENGTH=74 /DNA_ID=CAMNT_0011699005 /DNA_START=277 /DNA_END=497 /DNA_ORIENTATION=+